MLIVEAVNGPHLLILQSNCLLQSAALLLITRASQIFFVLLAFAFVFKLFGRQNRSALARPQLLLFNRHLVSLLRHADIVTKHWLLTTDNLPLIQVCFQPVPRILE
jgi:hypothetical protein